MRSKLVPESLAERLALCAGRVPGPIVDSIVPLLKARALMAAERLGVFEALRAGARSMDAVADELALDRESLDLLLRVLVASGYLEQRAGRYRLTSVARRTLLRGGSLECRGFLRFNYTQWRLLEHLDRLLQTGDGLDLHRTLTDPEEWENYQRAMLDVARTHAAFLARHVPVRRGAGLLLDVGGSHGLLGAAICRRYPPMRARVLELPMAVAPARRLSEEEGIAGLVEHVPADLRTDELGSGADVVLLANVVHHLSAEENLNLLWRARGALRAGGTVAVWDIEGRPEGAPAELGRDTIALFFRITSGSRCYPKTVLRRWLEDAGFRSVTAVRSPLAPLHLLVHARVSP
jgi:O-methyltransferase domain/Dimerisation domain